MLYTNDEGRTTKLLYKNITPTFCSWKRLKLLWCVRKKDRWTEGDRLLYWPIISSSLDHTTLCSSQGPTKHFCFSAGRFSSRCLLWATAPAGCSQRLQTETPRLPLTETPTWASAYIISQRPRFPINYTTAFTYLHRCILFRESLIDSLIKSQYATHESSWIEVWIS